jgi:hypothetical protein
MKDLVVLVADLDTRLTLEALLPRSGHLGCERISFQVITHPHRDSGVFQEAHEVLRAQSRMFRYAIAICDHHGCGQEALTRTDVEFRIERNLRANGWEDRAAAVVIEPELEAWIWGDWSALVKCSGWTGGPGNLRNWLQVQNLRRAGEAKPNPPKEALKRMLRQTNKRSSGALFSEIARTADSTSCIDQAFIKLRSTLQGWFPASR